MKNWNPIDTAPKDGTHVDLWVHCFSIGVGGKVAADEGRRITDARWDVPKHFYLHGSPSVGDAEEWVEWDGGNLDKIEIDGVRATHWMLPPGPPTL